MVAKHLWPTIRREAIWTACKRHGARWALTYETSSDVTEICGKSLEALPSTSLTRKIERRLAKKQFVFESRVREAQVKFQMPTHLCEMVMANHYKRLRSESRCIFYLRRNVHLRRSRMRSSIFTSLHPFPHRE